MNKFETVQGFLDRIQGTNEMVERSICHLEVEISNLEKQVLRCCSTIQHTAPNEIQRDAYGITPEEMVACKQSVEFWVDKLLKLKSSISNLSSKLSTLDF